jgi:hypothetical protein
MTQQAILRYCVMSALLAGLAFLVLNVLRLALIYNITRPFLLINAATVGCITLVGLYNWRRLRVERIEWFMLAALGLSFITADYSGRQPVDIAIDILRPLFFLGTVITLRQWLDVKQLEISPCVQKLVVAFVPITLLAVVGCYAYGAAVKPIYPAFSSIDSLLGLGSLMATGPFSLPLLFALVLFISGKRGVYLAAFVLLLWFYRRQKKAFASTVFAVVLAFALLAFNASGLPSSDGGSSSAAKASGSSEIFRPISATEKFLNIASGGRLDEVRDSMAVIPSPYRYIFGMGPGFSYPSAVFAEQGAMHRNLHFTPLCIIIYYGGVFATLFAFYLLRIALIALRALASPSSPLVMSYAVYMLGSLIFCLTEFSVFGYANFAIACGLLMATQRARDHGALAHGA